MVEGTKRRRTHRVEERMCEEIFMEKLSKLMMKETFNSMWTAMNRDERSRVTKSAPIKEES